MNVVFIIPTGIGCKIGGHAGDANPAFKLVASVCDIAICHPNVVNASDINEMPDNAWYVEGSILDRFLEGKLNLKKPKSNKILLAVSKPIRPETFNAVNAARHTLGCEIEVVELDYPLTMVGEYNSDGTAGGWYDGVDELLKQIKDYEFDALAIASRIQVGAGIALRYFKNGGINPWGGVEAIVSREIAGNINKPVAHAPIETDDVDVLSFNEVVDPRMAAEVISNCYIHCVFKGLHKAPRILEEGLSVRDIDFLVTPYQCFGRPHEAALKAGIPILGVKENTTCLKVHIPEEECYWVDNYIEAAGWLQSKKEGISASSISEDYIDELTFVARKEE
jgi:hypothetical protein